MRIARTLAVSLALIALGLIASPAPGHAAAAPVSPTGSIPIVGGLFGEDENEPDENEADEGSRQAQSAANHGGTSFSHVLLAFGLGIVATIYLARWYYRARAWVQQLARGRSAG
jgi:hypothetical protein